MGKRAQKFSVKQRIISFKFAFNGIKSLLKSEHNARIHFFVAVLSIGLGFSLKLDVREWALLVFAIGFVLVSEIFNTCLEEICNLITLAHHPQIRKIKDMAAAAVLISAICAVVIGSLLFVPKILQVLL